MVKFQYIFLEITFLKVKAFIGNITKAKRSQFSEKKNTLSV